MTTLGQVRALRAKIEASRPNHKKIHVTVSERGDITLIKNDNTSMIYTPTPFAKRFSVEKKRVNLVMGPYSSGKSIALIMEKFREAMNMPPCLDGIRRSRTIISRTTYSELWSSTINSFMDWFGDFGDLPSGAVKSLVQKPFPIFKIRFNDPRGTIEWEVYFMAFEKESHVKKLGSVEFTNGFVNELRDFPKSLFDAIQGRIGRYPKVQDLGTDEYPSSLDCDTNPPTETHWIKSCFEDDLPESFAFFKQNPGVIKDDAGRWIENPLRDNPYNSKGYYLHLIAGKTLEFINVFARGHYGLAFDGKPVFEEYNDDFHAVDDIEYVYGAPLYLGWDFGLTPCLVVCQYVQGQLRCIKEFVTESFGIENLIEQLVKPYWQTNGLYNYQVASSDADPAGKARSARNIDEPCLIEIITQSFIDTREAVSNVEEMRLESVRNFLNKMTIGQPAFLISKRGCPILREGFNGKYYLKMVSIPGKGEKMHTKSPEKTHPHSEPQDCVQYIALRLCANGPYDNKPSRVRATKISL